MVYIILILAALVVVAYAIIPRDRTRQPILFAVMVVSYVAAMCFFLIYLCKDSFHLGIFLNYFPFPHQYILKLYMLRIPKMALLRLLNIACIMFLYTNVLFTCSFLPGSLYRLRRAIPIITGVYFGLQLLLFDPYFYIKAYSFFYPAYFSSTGIEIWYGLVNQGTTILNSLFLILCVLAMIPSCMKLPRTKLFGLNLALVIVSYAMLAGSYLIFFSQLPGLMIKYSKVAGLITYQSLIGTGGMVFYQYLPYVALLLVVLLGLSYYCFYIVQHKADVQNQDVIRNIRAANVSSRLFCHYMKNEILAISAEVEDMAESSSDEQAIKNVLDRCDAIYHKLDGIHKSMRDNSMVIRRTRVDEPITAALESASRMKRMEDIAVSIQFPVSPVYSNLDPIFLEQALLEFILNASDAMQGRDTKELTIRLSHTLRWVVLEISDTGCGIDPANFTNIFTPLYTSKPISKNWGIGLTMAHKIITGFGGRVNLHSEVDKGTTFEMLLPAARQPRVKAKKNEILPGGNS